MRSPVAMLSLSSTGMPCSGPRTRFRPRSRSISSAIFSASGLISMMAFSRGPALSMVLMRARYCDVSVEDARRAQLGGKGDTLRARRANQGAGGQADTNEIPAIHAILVSAGLYFERVVACQ